MHSQNVANGPRESRPFDKPPGSKYKKKPEEKTFGWLHRDTVLANARQNRGGGVPACEFRRRPAARIQREADPRSRDGCAI
jgi:hypothetical protein